MHKLLLQVSKFESITISIKNNTHFNTIDFCCSELLIYYKHTHENPLRIGQESAGLVFEALIKRLKKAVNNNLQLHDSIQENLGCMWNKKFQNTLNLEFFMIPTPRSTSTYWIGLDYQIWETFNQYDPYVTTWMYNDHRGNIILEVTPFYRWSVQEQEADDIDFITYEAFMANYKPLLQRIIPRETALIWLEQSIAVYRSLFTDEEDYVRACKENGW